MKFSKLRSHIQNKVVQAKHCLKHCSVVIDADSFFIDTYRDSGCQFVLGPDCDRYAEYLLTKLAMFENTTTKVYVIFKGVSRIDLEKQKNINQSIIDKRNGAEWRNEYAPYFDPIFVTDVQKQVLEENLIRYFVCEGTPFEAIVGVAKKFKCPVITNNLEYSLFGISCIPTDSLNYNEKTKEINCSIYNNDLVRSTIGVYKKAPILLTALNESGEYYNTLRDLIDTGNFVQNAIQWTKRQKDDTLKSVALKFDDGNERKTFEETYEKLQKLYLYPTCHLAVKYFQRSKRYNMFKDDKKWFSKGIADGRLATPYVLLKRDGLVSGSPFVYNVDKPDALLAATDIIVYTHCVLTNSKDSNLTVVGRKYDKSDAWNISRSWNSEISNRKIFKYTLKRNNVKVDCNNFCGFLEEVLPGFSTNQLFMIPRSSWILILSLVYYIYKVNRNFVHEAYCILLSYVVLSNLSKKISVYSLISQLSKNSMLNGEINSNNKISEELKYLFDKTDLNRFDVTTIHNFCEFNHCLEYMNYLNKMFGEELCPCIVYHDSYNATFIYNTLMLKKDKCELMEFLKRKFEGTYQFELYESIIRGFETILKSVEKGSQIDVLQLQFMLD